MPKLKVKGLADQARRCKRHPRMAAFDWPKSRARMAFTMIHTFPLRPLVLAILLAAWAPVSFAQAWKAPWSVSGFTVDINRGSLPDGQEQAALRFTRPDGKVAAEFPGESRFDNWAFITDEIRLPGMTEPIAAFVRSSGGIHCCLTIETFRLGRRPPGSRPVRRREGKSQRLSKPHRAG
ncbi:hypothetical protein [Oleomonas cavernae]|uniref:hypothetical protein n=1 Tax=Oleomonas cavernae TaxID=2320859 RepID=UPI0011C46B0D|nr:hypothetical protein [Oleomonas cavernae]